MTALVAALVTGLTGTVAISPAQPVCQVGVPCSKPAPGLTVRFVRRNGVVATTVTAADGGYRVRLAPGTYVVRIGMRMARPTPATVVVRRTGWTRQNIAVDTGIR
ncbi:MAG TPA: carboxypeptidase regulatory-like domain-containing protein [Gaiellaceae bacterium]|nr:carboxypeptidase regulatory-like domain-containing protein [Gaiellaceae bacterium]